MINQKARKGKKNERKKKLNHLHEGTPFGKNRSRKKGYGGRKNAIKLHRKFDSKRYKKAELMPCFFHLFKHIAVPMILGEIKRFLRDDGKIKLSRQLKTEMRNLKAFQQEYYNRYGKSPKISYLAQKMGISRERVMEVLEAIDSLSSIESLDNELIPEGMHGGNYVDEEQQNVELLDLKAAIRDLADRERQIIVLRYFRDMTQQQIASVLGISQVQVSRIEKKVLGRMREKMQKIE